VSYPFHPVTSADNQLDIDADVVVKRGILGSGQGDILGNVLSSGPSQKSKLLGGVLDVTVGDHGYNGGRHHHAHHYGHYDEDELLDAVADIEVDDLAIKRGYYDPNELMAEIEAEAELNADHIIYGKRDNRFGEDALDIEADLDIDVDVVHRGDRFYERRGLLNNQNGVKGAVDVSDLTMSGPELLLIDRLSARTLTIPSTRRARVTVRITNTVSTSTPRSMLTLTEAAEYTGTLEVCFEEHTPATLSNTLLRVSTKMPVRPLEALSSFPIDLPRLCTLMLYTRTPPLYIIALDE
jgi:hypothetical protein